MAPRRDYYAILGVDKHASQEEIKRAYRKLARKHHPDVNPGDRQAEERFKEIAEAYHVLGDPQRRQRYDRMGPDAFAQEFDLSEFLDWFQRAFGGRRRSRPAYGFGGLEDLFGGLGEILGDRGAFTWTRAPGAGGPRPRGGRHVQVPIELSFEEALRGTQRAITYRRPQRCEGCGGTGRGVAGTCPRCGGKGETTVTETARVRIPAGVEDAARIRVRGRGERGHGGGPPGDLYLKVSVRPHRIFRRRGDDLHVEVPVAVYEAALGGTIEVPTLEGPARISVPPGTRSGQVFRLRGKGAPRRGGGRGDLYVTVRIDLPERLDRETKEMLRRMRRDHPYNPRAHLTEEQGEAP